VVLKNGSIICAHFENEFSLQVNI